MPTQSPIVPTFIDCNTSDIQSAKSFVLKAKRYLKSVQELILEEGVKIENAIEKCSTDDIDAVFNKYDT